MPDLFVLLDPRQFSEALYETMTQIHPGIAEMELYEFRYALDLMLPSEGWDSIQLETMDVIEFRIQQPEFFSSVQLRPRRNNQIVMDRTVSGLSQMLFAGLVSGVYPPEWVRQLFYFDIRAFAFFVRTQYFTPEIIRHFGGQPYRAFEPAQKRLEAQQDIGYKEFRDANQAVDGAFLETIQKLIALKGIPLLLTLVGPTAAGKTEIVSCLQQKLVQNGLNTTAIEMDNFYKDREFRDGKPMDKNVIHFEIFQNCMTDLLHGRETLIPRYDFVAATSSHDLNSRLKAGQTMLQVEPADIILLEGNFPFHIPEIAPMIGIKVVYLTDDPIRLKRKWRRDVDYRKKYDRMYLCNRFFRTQFLRAEEVYHPMMAVSDIVVDTTAAAIWVTPGIAALLE